MHAQAHLLILAAPEIVFGAVVAVAYVWRIATKQPRHY